MEVLDQKLLHHLGILQDQNGIGPLVDSVTFLPVHLIVLFQGDVGLVLLAEENPGVLFNRHLWTALISASTLALTHSQKTHL